MQISKISLKTYLQMKLKPDVLQEVALEDTSSHDDEDDENPGDVLEPHRLQFKYGSAHPQDLIISDRRIGTQTRSSIAKGRNDFCTFNAFLSQLEPKG